MRKYLLMSHGLMASGIQNTLTMLIGKTEHLTVITAYIDEETDIQKEISQILDTLSSKDDELVVFTDILGGSINNDAMLFINNPKVHLITGVNIATIAEVINNDGNYPLKDIIESAILLGREALVYCNTQNQNIIDEDF